MKEVFKYYKQYKTYLKKYNNLVRARNKRRLKNYKGSSIRGPEGMEEESEESLIGFLSWGAENEAA